MFPKVSVIVPVYNAEKYLKKCIESILSQTIRKIELILIDDCSTDNSRTIIKEYCGNARVKSIFLANNTGASAARNAGLKIASGDYISFVDSDDFIAPDMYEIMLNSDADIISCGYKKCDDEGNIISNNPFPLKDMNTKEEIIAAIKTAHKTRFIWYSVRNIYKRNIITSNNITFNEGVRIGEDSIFCLYCFGCAKNVHVVNEAFYYYTDNPNSATAKKGNPYLESSLALQYDEKIKFYDKFGFDKSVSRDLSEYIVTHQMPMLLKNRVYLRKNIRGVFLMPMIKDSLKLTPFFNFKLSKGVQLIILLVKLKQFWLLKIMLSR